jgi:paraquat-inducible protein A
VSFNAISEVMACADCDLLQTLPPLKPGGHAACERCGRHLARRLSGSVDRPLALTFAALITLAIANLCPLMDLHVAGRFASTTIAGGAYEMWAQGQRITGVLVLFCAVLAPFAYLLFMLVLLLAARRNPVPQFAGEMLRWIGHLQVWSMLEVVMLGILVALTKIAELATVAPGIGMYAFGASILLVPAIMTSFDRRDLWHRVQWYEPSAATVGTPNPSSAFLSHR